MLVVSEVCLLYTMIDHWNVFDFSELDADAPTTLSEVICSRYTTKHTTGIVLQRGGDTVEVV